MCGGYPAHAAFRSTTRDALAASLTEHGIDYWHLKALYGRRSKGELHGAPPEDFWTNASVARYAAYARSATFAQGLDELLQRARRQRCVLMCSEAVWWRCHRRIITDHLLAHGATVYHIMGPGKIMTATLTRGSRVRNAEVIYPKTDEPTA